MAFYKILRDRTIYPAGKEEPGQAGWIADRLLRLRAMLNGEITSKRRPNSLVLGSWNIRHFDGGRARLPESFHYIAEIIDHFDICAIQEVKNIRSIERLNRLLGPNWDYFINDSSGGGRGNHERMAFMYNKNRVFFRNLIGEVVFPNDALPGGEQVGRTPFFASFQAGWFRFTLCSAHIVYKEEEGRPLREDEIGVIAKELAARAEDTKETHIFLGDMNIEKLADGGMMALLDNGFRVPNVEPTSLGGDKYYDHIAFVGPEEKCRFLEKGVIKWQEAVFTEDEATDYEEIAKKIREKPNTGKPYKNWSAEYRKWRTHEMSDHLPIWIELEVDYSNNYLMKICNGA